MHSKNPQDNSRITRRAALGAAFALSAAVAAGSAMSQQMMQSFVPPGRTPKPKGPRVFMDYDKEEIDWAYDRSEERRVGKECRL